MKKKGNRVRTLMERERISEDTSIHLSGCCCMLCVSVELCSVKEESLSC